MGEKPGISFSKGIITFQCVLESKPHLAPGALGREPVGFSEIDRFVGHLRTDSRVKN